LSACPLVFHSSLPDPPLSLLTPPPLIPSTSFLQMLLFLFLLPLVSPFLFGCNQCQQQLPFFQQPPQPSYYPPPQPQYYPQPSYPQQQGYVAAPPRPQPLYRNPLRQYNIPQGAYTEHAAPPSYGPTPLSRSGYGNDFVGEGSVPLRPSVEGQRATYIINRHGANSLKVYGEDPIRTLAPQSSIVQPTVDEITVEANAPIRQSVQVISESQPVHPVEKLWTNYRPPVTQVEPAPQINVEPAAPSSYSPPPVVDEPARVIESTSEFLGEQPTAAPPTLQYPIEQQGYDSVPETPVVPYEPSTYSPPVQSVGYDGVKRFAGFNQLRATGLAKVL
ncbi:hypothetical protein PMAYCL1PPCAC_18761, partial [Pristionchus mayeri]